MSSHLGEMLRLYRNVRDVSIRSMAGRIGVSSATLFRVETGRACDAETLLKLLAWMLAPRNENEK